MAPSTRALPAAAEAVVVGGGIMGASALWHLARAGCTDAVLLERETLGSGSTSKAAGGLRAQFSDPLNTAIGLAGIERFARMSEELGVDVGFRRCGYLYLLTNEADLAVFDADLERQTALGIGTVRLTGDDVAAMVPGLRTDDLLAANWRADDGAAAPEAAVQAYTGGATALGARIVQSCPVEAILVERGAVTGVQTPQGRVATDTVILTAGVWSRPLAAGVGVDLPVTPLVKHVFFTDGGDTLPRDLPVITDYAPRLYFHREGRGLLLGGLESTIEELGPAAAHRVPQLEDIGIRGGWFGAYDMSPDANAMIGRLPEPSGLLYATGFSGHGFMQGPVVGEHLAELALGLQPTFDLGALGLERFARGTTRTELHVV